MGTGYVRNDTANNIADGNVINATDLDGEFDAVQAAFNASTGHSHDGTTGEGPKITSAGLAAGAVDSSAVANNSVALGTKTTGNYVAAGAVSGTGLSGSASAEGATFTVSSNATNANTASTIVARDASGNFSAGTITANLTGNVSGSSGSTTGNAATATALATGRTIGMTGDVVWTSASFDGSGNVTGTATIQANSVALGTDTTGNYVAAGAVSGTGLSGSSSSEGGTFTVTSNATNANTASTIVARDGSGNFSAGTITATAFSGDGSALTGVATPTLSSLGIANHNLLTVNTDGDLTLGSGDALSYGDGHERIEGNNTGLSSAGVIDYYLADARKYYMNSSRFVAGTAATNHASGSDMIAAASGDTADLGVCLNTTSNLIEMGVNGTRAIRINQVNATNLNIMFEMRRHGTAVGGMGITNSGTCFFEQEGSTGGGITLRSNLVVPSANDGSDRDDLTDLGSSGARWKDIYAGNGTINTSDENEKQQIASLTTAEMTAAKNISALFKTYKWNSAVTAKGSNARTHVGVIAQNVQTAMSSAGLDAANYGFFTSDTWWETAINVAEYTDPDSGDVREAHTYVTTYATEEEANAALATLDLSAESLVKRTRLGVRYHELFAFVSAYHEQKLNDFETRIAALESA
jgi:hypothetical protein